MLLGLDILTRDFKDKLKGKRVGILGHQASVNSKGQHILDLLVDSKDWKVTTLFGPEHGITTSAQDMEPVHSGTHKPTGLPLYSLYGHSEKELKPTEEMLKNIDCLVIDLQDVGARYYTYIWTTTMCMEACAKYKKEVIVCDRPNPINGLSVEGESNKEGYTSFVGLYPMPVRHGMTIGEMARMINDTEDLNCDLTVMPMEGWQREWFWDQTGLKWTNPSPNMRSPLQALLYPGTCLLEGTNISEGRGTDIPFEITGAPFVKPAECLESLSEFRLPGVQFEPVEFTPTLQKWVGQKCFGVRLKVTDREIFKPYVTGIALIWALYTLYHDKGFQWRLEPYEFIEDIPAIDLLTGDATVRQALEKHLPLRELLEWVAEPSSSFVRQRKPYLLY
ncbi:MAG: hypothetical protein A2W61_04365 [Deltaproteobacteria bacterium RIFCSPLOWO2_01_44_7]|nr:MAG: hypothetical protein A2712_01895 [Deltaproteobacteria bacterium RIFCSPHIGHO2_01_FULL_43_49]OGQ15121.1 MAG: hypothetical protein A3D22_03580 [Deltaproteobacteria bacterium RIFCSPHIGHO2_02_FULL_44_53]OGQ27258.1 MAG: hypothetical protein A3D98_02490 [Deltaproteobacteria bacterium RIFCSPHIGHO2_12_FULL_44_21]OGQ31638.1 MAG: hypothetical protein A2979_04740 [Deltaproteobacteria bacterium RIFCSPLOWO2_01_FULL_45_74]OGQ42838.1 MAG: hypothetical protein A3I70_07045 [Deltaproteobacteria bacterium 